MPDSNKYNHVYKKSRIKTSKLKERRKKETLLDSNPHLLSAKDSLLGYRGIVFFFHSYISNCATILKTYFTKISEDWKKGH